MAPPFEGDCRRLRQQHLGTHGPCGTTSEVERWHQRPGITSVHAGLLPAGKSALVDWLRHERSPVAMVGDGINDAPALAGITVVHRGGPARLLAVQARCLADR